MRRLLLILVLAVTILGSGGAGDGQSRELRIGLPRLPVVLDPATAQDASDRVLYPQIFETLVRVGAVGRTAAATVRTELAQPFAPLLAVLAHPALAIVLPTSDVVAGATRPFL